MDTILVEGIKSPLVGCFHVGDKVLELTAIFQQSFYLMYRTAPDWKVRVARLSDFLIEFKSACKDACKMLKLTFRCMNFISVDNLVQ